MALTPQSGDLAPSGTAGFGMANGSLSSYQSGEGDIRKKDGRASDRRQRSGEETGIS